MARLACEISKDTYLKIEEVFSILDVGTTADEYFDSSNIVLKELATIDNQITVFSDQIIPSSQFHNLMINESIVGDIANHKFKVKYDLVIASAVLEHVGDESRQRDSIENILSASERFILITVPNRWHPIEFHSRIPLIHWLPNFAWRKCYKLCGFKELAKPENLNFISPKQIVEFAGEFYPDITHRTLSIKLFGIKSNHVVIFEK